MKAIPGWPDYYAGTDGHIYSSKGKALRRLKPQKGSDTCPYLHVSLCRSGQRPKTLMVHTLVALAYLGYRPDGLETSHKNGLHFDNRPVNLVYETRSENLNRRVQHGTSDRGVGNSRAVLTQEQADTIRYQWANREFRTQAEVAAHYKVSRTTIIRVLKGERYL